MYFPIALERLTDGRAVKPPFFAGYFKRTDLEHPADYDPSGSGYAAGDSVVYRSVRYICVEDVDSESVKKFDPKKWKKVDFDHNIVAVNRAGDEFVCGVTFTFDDESAKVVKAYSDFSPALEVTGELMNGLMSGLWSSATADEFEQCRDGGDGSLEW